MKKLLLIDAYAMIFRAYYAFIRAPRINSKGENLSAVFGFCLTLEDMLKKVQPTHIGVAFDPKGGTFRHEAYPAYKAQRDATPEDIHKAVPIIKEILVARRMAVYEVAGFEADDVIGTLADKAAAAGFEVLMATPDKDYGQLVTEHIHQYRPRHSGGFEELGPQDVCNKYGINNTAQVLDLLALMGDSADNIPGCKGVGEKTAVQLIQQFGSVEQLLDRTDELKGALRTKVETQKEEIRFSKFLATIRRDVPVELNEDELQRKDDDLEALYSIYRTLEFRSLIKEHGNERSASPATNPAIPTKVETVFSTVSSERDARKESLYQAGTHSNQHDVTNTNVRKHSPQKGGYQLNLFGESADEGQETRDKKQELLPVGAALAGNETYETSIEERTQIAHYLLQPEMKHDIEYLEDIYGAQGDALLAAVENELKKDERLWRLYTDVELPLAPILRRMENAGVRFDKDILREASDEMHQELNGIEKDILAIVEDVKAEHVEAVRLLPDFNISSPKQVGELLFGVMHLDPKAKKTKGGQYVTSEEVLQSIKERHPIISKILEYRELKKLLSTYIDALPALIDPVTGKIHTTYNQTVTATGRLSSSNPNMQNLPIRSERGQLIRKAVVADAGCLFVSADYSQIELRLMAHLSGDRHMIEAFRAGDDIHAATAAKIFDCPISEVSREQRRRAKTANFGIIYGISAFGLSQQLECSRQEAKQLIDDYFAAFPGVMRYIEQQKEQVRQNGYAETLFGRKRFLPDIYSQNNTVRSFAERNAVNAPIQGTAADIIKIAMVRIDRRLQEEGLRAQMIMQVHDELNFNVPQDEAERVRQLVVEEMQGVVELSVPLIAECGIGHNWLEAH